MLVNILTFIRYLIKKTGLLPVIKRLLYQPSSNINNTNISSLRYKLKCLIEQANYTNTQTVHDLPAIHHYWADKYLIPLFSQFGYQSIADFFYVELRSLIEYSDKLQQINILSIGSGNCDFEVALAKKIISSGFSNFTIECMDFNHRMLARGRCLARDNEVEHHILPLEADFNKWTHSAQSYDAILANQSLHHVVNLTGLFDNVKFALKSNGRFIVSDMIGRNGHMRWPEALDIVNKFWQELPHEYRYNQHLAQYFDIYENFDCSQAGFEGINAQDILPLLVERFSFESFIPFANAVDVFVDRAIGPNFDPLKEWDRDFIDRVHMSDVENIDAGRIKPTHMIASMTSFTTPATRYPGMLSPEFCIRIS